MPRKRRPRTKQPRPPSGRDLKARAEALLVVSEVLHEAAKAKLIDAKARAIDAATARGDRTAGFVGPLADAGGTVAAQTEED
jgi:hypothetical protein